MSNIVKLTVCHTKGTLRKETHTDYLGIGALAAIIMLMFCCGVGLVSILGYLSITGHSAVANGIGILLLLLVVLNIGLDYVLGRLK